MNVSINSSLLGQLATFHPERARCKIISEPFLTGNNHHVNILVHFLSTNKIQQVYVSSLILGG
jgi:hypothetical protein